MWAKAEFGAAVAFLKGFTLLTLPEETIEDKKRKRDQMYNGVTEDEIEAHRKRRLLADDPMANYVDDS